MSTIQIRIDEKTKQSAKKVLESLGIDLSGAIKLFLKQVIVKKGIPFQVLTENGLTVEREMEILKAMKDMENGIGCIGPFDGKGAVEYLKKISKKNT